MQEREVEDRPLTPEMSKIVALDRTVSKLVQFSTYLRDKAKREEVELSERLEDADWTRDAIYEYIGIDSEKIQEESKMLTEWMKTGRVEKS